MSNPFIMGAEIRLNDQFSPQISHATQASNKFKEGLGSLKGALVAVAGSMAIKASFDWLVQGNADMETYQNTLAVVMKSQEKAVETLAWANKFAATTPFEIPQVVEATTMMESYGLNAKKTLGIVGDMASVMGKDLLQAVNAVSDAQTGETERLKEFGITKGMLQEHAKLLGSNPINNQGQITDQKAFNAALFSLMEKRFKGGMELQSKTFKGMLSNAKDFMSSTGRELGKPIFDAFKVGLGGALTYLNKLQSDGTVAAWANNVKWAMDQAGNALGVIYTKAKPVFDYLNPALGTLAHLYIAAAVSEFKLMIKVIGDLYADAKPALTWIAVNGFAVIAKTLGTVWTEAKKVSDFINDNWSTIKPLVEGIIIAFGIYRGVIAAIEIATGIATTAQWLWNAAMTANPIGLVILGIGLLIGAGILLYNNWDMLKQGASDMWIGIENAFKTGVNKAIGWLNYLIDAANKIPGIDIGHVETLQMGQTSVQKQDSFNAVRGIDGSHAMGLSYVPFDGYLAELHKGERVLTAAETRDVDTVQKQPTASVRTVTIGKLFDSLTIHGTKDMDEEKLANVMVDKLYTMLTEAEDILGSADMGVLL